MGGNCCCDVIVLEADDVIIGADDVIDGGLTKVDIPGSFPSLFGLLLLAVATTALLFPELFELASAVTAALTTVVAVPLDLHAEVTVAAGASPEDTADVVVVGKSE